MKNKFIKVKNNESKGVIVFIHGFATTSDYFDEIANRLAEYYDYYALELPGMGRTDVDDLNKLSPEYYANLIIEWIKEHKELNNIILIGHSMGGGIVNIVGSKIPEKISKIITICPMSSAFSFKLINAFKIAQYTEKKVYKLSKIIYKYYEKKFPNKENDKQIKELVKFHISTKKANKKLFSKMRSLKNNKILREAEKAINVPTLLITAKEDKIIDSKLTSKKLLKNKNFSWVEINDSGHVPFEEQLETTLKVILDFLNH